jgi:hypothetical protein
MKTAVPPPPPPKKKKQKQKKTPHTAIVIEHKAKALRVLDTTIN